MAHHLSAKKRIRQTETKRLKNKYYSRSARSAVKELRSTEDKAAATEQYSKVVAMLDKLAKNNVIHKNKASNLKSKLARRVQDPARTGECGDHQASLAGKCEDRDGHRFRENDEKGAVGGYCQPQKL